jgi:hypothetical protein
MSSSDTGGEKCCRSASVVRLHGLALLKAESHVGAQPVEASPAVAKAVGGMCQSWPQSRRRWVAGANRGCSRVGDGSRVPTPGAASPVS